MIVELKRLLRLWLGRTLAAKVTLENIGRVLGAFNLKWIKPDLAVETPRVKDLERAEKLGEKLAKICSCKTATSPFEFGETFQGAIEMGILTK